MGYFTEANMAGEQTEAQVGFDSLMSGEALFADAYTQVGQDALNAIAEKAGLLQRGLATAEYLVASAQIDQVGQDSGQVTGFGATASAHTMAALIEVGLGEEPEDFMSQVGQDSGADPVGAVKTGHDAKDSLATKIIQGGKKIIAAIINWIKTFVETAGARISLIGKNAKKLKDMVDELDDGKYTFDKKEDKDVHNRYLKITGRYYDHDLNTFMSAVKENVQGAYKLLNFEDDIKKVYEDIKASKETAKADLNKTATKAVAELKTEKDLTKPAKQELDRLIVKVEAKGIFATELKFPNKTVVLSLLDDGDKPFEKLKTVRITSDVQTDDKTVSKTFTTANLKSAVTDLVKNMADYSAVDAIKGLRGNILDIEKDMVDLGKKSNAKAFKATQAYVAFLSSSIKPSADVITANQIAMYNAIKLIAANVE